MKSKISLMFALLLLASSNSFALVGAVSNASGGTGRGAVEPVDGILLNPATISDLPKKEFAVNYSKDDWAIVATDNGVDSYFPAALQFRRQNTPAFDTQQLGLTIASRRWKRISFGGTASVLEYTNFISSSTEQRYRQSTLDLGATWAVSKDIGFGIVGKKIASNRIDLPPGLQAQNTLGAGVSYTYQNFARFRFDVESGPEANTDQLVYMAGIENYVNDWLVFRVGYKTDNVVGKDYFTAGAGFAGPQFGLHYAYITNVSDKSEDQHLIDLAVPF